MPHGPSAGDDRRRLATAEIFAQRDATMGDLYDVRRGDQAHISYIRSATWGRHIRKGSWTMGTTLEIGAGHGAPLRWALEAGATTAIAIDISEDRLCAARRFNAAINPLLADAVTIPLRSESVDTIICSTIFSSILDDTIARQMAREITRVLKPVGLVLWFDFYRDNPRNKDVRAVGKADILDLFPGLSQHLQRAVLAPPLAKRLERWPRTIAILEALPMLRTHLVGSLSPRPDRS